MTNAKRGLKRIAIVVQPAVTQTQPPSNAPTVISYPESSGFLDSGAPLSKKPEDSGYEIDAPTYEVLAWID